MQRQDRFGSRTLVAVLVLTACPSSEVATPPSLGAPVATAPAPEAASAGAPEAVVAGAEGEEPPGPPPAPRPPATFRGATPVWMRAFEGAGWLAVAVPGARGLDVVWWSPDVGDVIDASPGAVWPADAACDVVARNGQLVCVKGGELLWLPSPGDERPVPATITVGAARAVHASPSGEWVALVGEGIRVVDPAGKVAWEGPGPVIAAGWHEQRLVWADGSGEVHELLPEDSGVRHPGKLQGNADEWTVSPAGAFAAREGNLLRIHPPGAFGTQAAPTAWVELPQDVRGVDWLGPERFVARSPAGLHVYVEGQRTLVSGELADGAPAAWP